MQQALALFEPGNTAIYLMAILLGLYVHYLVAKKNGRTTATTFSDYWLVETPGLSIATLLTLATAAGALMKSGVLTGMDTYSVVLLGFGKAYLFDSVIQAPPAAAGAPAADPAKPQAGFARLGMLVVLAALALPFLAGCPSVPQKDLPDSKVLPATASQILKGIVLAKETLDVAYSFIADAANQDLLDPAQGRRWFVQLDGYRDRLAKAESLLNAGNFDAAKLQSEGMNALIKIIHDQAIEAVKRSARKPVLFVLTFATQPVWRFQW